MHDVRAQGVFALHAEPGAAGHLVELDTVSMVRGVAAVAEQERLLVAGRVAHGASTARYIGLFGELLYPFSGVVLRYYRGLSLVLNFAGG